MKLSKLNSFKSTYLMEVDSSLKSSNTTVCNVYVDEENKALHFYDDLRHHSTTILSEVDRNNDLIIEFSSLLGIKCNDYKIYFYYTPITNNPFVLKYDLSTKKKIKAKNEEIYFEFLKMTEADEETIKK